MSTALGYTYLTQWTARRFTNRGRVVKGITIHHWGSLGSDFMGIVGWFCNPNTIAQTSAHYCIQGANADGSTARRVACIVDPDLIAWHAGDWQANVDTIGIECRPEARDVDYQVVAELVARLWVTYGVVPLYPHRHWVPTTCPGRYDVTRIAKEARDKYRQLTSPTPTPPEVDMQFNDIVPGTDPPLTVGQALGRAAYAYTAVTAGGFVQRVDSAATASRSANQDESRKADAAATAERSVNQAEFLAATTRIEASIAALASDVASLKGS